MTDASPPRDKQRVLVLQGGPKGPPAKSTMTVGDLRRHLRKNRQ